MSSLEKKLILVRYGSWENGHLSKSGREEMQRAGRNLSRLTAGKKTLVVSANVTRAIESAQVVANVLGLDEPRAYDEFYAAEEEGKPPKLAQAYKLVESLLVESDILISIVSREYIEALPTYILNDILGSSEALDNSSLDRGEALLINLRTKELGHI